MLTDFSLLGIIIFLIVILFIQAIVTTKIMSKYLKLRKKIFGKEKLRKRDFFFDVD